jgi:hypothetical protein
MPETGTESESDSDQPPATGFNVGDIVFDRESDDDGPSAAYVTTLPDATADEWIAYEETTVAEDNPDYSADAPVVVVVYTSAVHYDLPNWNRYTPLSVSEIEEAGALYYAFPAPRLVRDQKRPHAPETQRARAESDSDSASDESEQAEPEGETETLTDEEPSKSEDETTSASPADADPSAAVVALSRFLNSDGMDAAIAADGQSVRVTKADDSYRVSLDSGVEGDGPHRSQLEEAVEKVRAATEAPNE